MPLINVAILHKEKRERKINYEVGFPYVCGIGTDNFYTLSNNVQKRFFKGFFYFKKASPYAL
jgi:hypothetical protein